MTHGERATFLRAMADGLRERTEDFGQIWPRESGALHSIARFGGLMAAGTFDYYAGLADIYPFEEAITPTMGGEFGLLVREPVGVVGAIIPWNGPLSMIATKVAASAVVGLHDGGEVFAGGTGRGIPGGRDRRSRGPSCRGVERPDGRPRGVRAPGARSAGRQNHLHRVDRRRPSYRGHLW